MHFTPFALLIVAVLVTGCNISNSSRPNVLLQNPVVSGGDTSSGRLGEQLGRYSFNYPIEPCRETIMTAQPLLDAQ